MEDVEICVDQDGGPSGTHDHRFLLGGPRLDDSQRRLVDKCGNCISAAQRWKDATFLRVLKGFFLICLSLSLGTFLGIFIMDYHKRDVVMFLLVLAAVVAFALLLKMKIPPPPKLRKVEIETISGHVQQTMSSASTPEEKPSFKGG